MPISNQSLHNTVNIFESLSIKGQKFCKFEKPDLNLKNKVR